MTRRARLVIREWERQYIEPGHAQAEYVENSGETIVEGDVVRVTPSGFCVVRDANGKEHRSKKFRLLDDDSMDWSRYGLSAYDEIRSRKPESATRTEAQGGNISS